MLNYFPTYFSNRFISLYFVVLLVVSIVFFKHAMHWYWMLFGIVEVTCFFYFSNKLSVKWGDYSSKFFTKQLFKTAFIIRAVVAIFLYFFFDYMTGQPFMFAAADSLGYHYEAEWIARLISNDSLSVYFDYIAKQGGVSDVGYPFWLGIQYWVTSNSIIIARIIKALLGAYTCVLIYKLAARNFGESVGRMSAIFCMLMPNLIIYTGMHLKETEMIFLTVAAVERIDFLLRADKFSIKNMAMPLLLILSLFFFRTVLGAAALFSLFSTLFLSSTKVVNLNRRVVVVIVSLLFVSYFMGGRISDEIDRYWADRDTNQETRLADRARKGNEFAKYAGAAVFSPMIFTLPFPTMIETPNQEMFRMLHGGVFVKNMMSFFAILAFVLLILRNDWQKHVLLMVFLVTYLGIIALSAFAHSERFHLLAVPFLLIFVAYGVSQINKKNIKYFNYWSILMFVAIVGWSMFKLGGRGWI